MIVVLVVAVVIGKVGTDAMTGDASTSNSAPVTSESTQESPSAAVREGTAAVALCKGTEKSIPEATKWKPGQPGIVATFTFDSLKSRGEWSSPTDFLVLAPLRTGVSPGVDLAKVALVMCRGRGELQSKTTCNYMIDNRPTPVEIRFWKQNLRLFEARTGRLLGQSELGNDSTECSSLIVYESGDEGSGIDQYPSGASERALLEGWTATNHS